MEKISRKFIKQNAKLSIGQSNINVALFTLLRYGVTLFSVFLIFGFDVEGVIYYYTTDSNERDISLTYELMGLAATLFVNVIYYGDSKFSLTVSRYEEANFQMIFSGFETVKRFFKIIATVALSVAIIMVKTFLLILPVYFLISIISPLSQMYEFFIMLIFVLALFIPIVGMALSYAQIHFILADNVDASSFEALSWSKDMMRGRKWEYFVLLLSFMPQAFLVLITFGIASLWVEPYINVTLANFYNSISNFKPESETNEEDYVEKIEKDEIY